MKNKADIIKFLETEQQLGFIKKESIDRLKFYFETYFNDQPTQPVSREGEVTAITAMQELIQQFKDIQKDGYNIAPEAAIALATELLAKERGQKEAEYRLGLKAGIDYGKSPI